MALSKGKKLLALGILLVVIDQVIKILVKTNMSLGEHFNVIGNWFQILFIENPGMAFGMKFGGAMGKLLLSVFRVALCGLLCWWIAGLSRRGTDKARTKDAGKEAVPTGVLVGLTLITAGAFGNIVDCVLYGQIFTESTQFAPAAFGGSYAPLLFGKVVDMFYFPLFTWPDWVPLVGGDIFFEPVFNFADSCVTVGAFYLILFQWRFFSTEDEKEESSGKVENPGKVEKKSK